MSNKTAYKLANEFSRVIKQWLTLDEIAEVNRLNATNEYADCCATHNYCDANMAMDEAFTNVTGRQFCFLDNDIEGSAEQNEKDTNLFNAAWEIAKCKQFNVTPKEYLLSLSPAAQISCAQQVANKLAAEGITLRNYSNDRAKMALQKTTCPNFCTRVLFHYELRVLNFLA